jgi:hypothetical protein
MRRLEELDCPKSVPWDFIGEHQDVCRRNHDQSAERLAERGGLGPGEMLAVIEPGTPTWAAVKALWYMSAEESVPRLKAALADWKSKR